MKEEIMVKQRVFFMLDYSLIRQLNGVNFSTAWCRYFVCKAKFILAILFFSLVVPSMANAHRGARNDIDICRISVGDQVVHFTAYTPTLTPGAEYCRIIPNVGLTDLVFDYEGNKLRNTTVEFEITKEPAGERVFYREPEKIKKGSVDAKVDFSQFGASEYLAHISILHNGEKLDSHLPFTVGLESEAGGLPTFIIILLALIGVIVVIMFVLSKPKKA